MTPSSGRALQDLRAALLRLVTHVVVANSALVPLCLRVLTMGLQPPPAAPVQPLPCTSPSALPEWVPSPEVLDIQGQVIEALAKVRRALLRAATSWPLIFACISPCTCTVISGMQPVFNHRLHSLTGPVSLPVTLWTLLHAQATSYLQ
jgi:hypothetical protein